VKQTNFKIQDPKGDKEINKKSGVIKNKQFLDQIKLIKDLLDEVQFLVEPADRGMISNNNACVISNFVE